MSKTQEQRDEIRRRLPHGSISRIAESIGRSRMAVSNWFHGSQSLEVEVAVLKELERVTRLQQEVDSKVKELLD